MFLEIQMNNLDLTKRYSIIIVFTTRCNEIERFDSLWPLAHFAVRGFNTEMKTRNSKLDII